MYSSKKSEGKDTFWTQKKHSRKKIANNKTFLLPKATRYKNSHESKKMKGTRRRKKKLKIGWKKNGLKEEEQRS